MKLNIETATLDRPDRLDSGFQITLRLDGLVSPDDKSTYIAIANGSNGRNISIYRTKTPPTTPAGRQEATGEDRLILMRRLIADLHSQGPLVAMVGAAMEHCAITDHTAPVVDHYAGNGGVI